MDITNEQASRNILAACDAGTLVQGRWHDRGSDGREIACLLGSIHPSVTSPAECNGDLMTMWLAELTPVLFDGIAAEHIYPMARRYGELVGRWHALSSAQWDNILNRVLIRCIDDAVDTARPVSGGKPYWPQVEAACAQSKAAIESGDPAARAAAEAAAGAAAYKAARAAAWAAGAAAKMAAEAAARAAEAAARAAAWAARAAAEAARAAAEMAAGAAAWAARAAAKAARAAAKMAAEAAARAAAWAARAAAEAARAAAGAAAYHRLFTFVLDQIEAELTDAL